MWEEVDAQQLIRFSKVAHPIVTTKDVPREQETTGVMGRTHPQSERLALNPSPNMYTTRLQLPPKAGTVHRGRKDRMTEPARHTLPVVTLCKPGNCCPRLSQEEGLGRLFPVLLNET